MNAAARLTLIVIGLFLLATGVWAQDGEPVGIGSGLTPIDFAADAGPQVFLLQTTPDEPTTLSASADPADFPYLVEVRDPRGNVTARLTNVIASRLTLDNSNRSYEITVIPNDPARAGQVILDIEGAIEPETEVEATPAPVEAEPVGQAQSAAGEIACFVSTNSRVNIRREPNVDAEVVGLLTVRTQIGANGLSSDGLWYGVVMLDDTQAWIFGEAVREVSPCNFN